MTSQDPIAERIVLFLLPYFVGVSDDVSAIRRAIFESLEALGATTQADLLTAAQAIAFGFAALDTLAEAHAAGHPEPVRTRLHACANALRRSARQCESALAKRRAAKPPMPPAEAVKASACAPKPGPQDYNHVWANALREVAGEFAPAPA